MSEAPYNPAQAAQRDIVYIIGNIAGIGSIILGCLGALLSFIPLIGVIAIPMCIGGCFFGGVGILILLLGKRGSIKFPLIGVLLCIAALIFCIVVNVVFLSAAANSAQPAMFAVPF